MPRLARKRTGGFNITNDFIAPEQISNHFHAEYGNDKYFLLFKTDKRISPTTHHLITRTVIFYFTCDFVTILILSLYC